jgi:hypothetical protein
MSATVFFQGTAELATLTNTFSISGTPTDPTTVSLTTTDPTGAQVTYTYAAAQITRTSAGVYTIDIPCTLDGVWSYTWTGTGAASDIIKGSWTVGPSTLNQNYCSAEELKSRLRITSTADDSEIALAIAGASRAIDSVTERYFWRGTDTRTYVPGGLYECGTDDLVSVTTLATDPGGTTPQGGTFPITWPAGSWQLLPYNPGKTGELWPYTSIRAVGGLTFPWVTPLLLMRMDRVQVTGVFGWPAVPQPIRSAALIAASELFRMKDTPVGGAGPGEFAVAVVQSNPMIGKLIGRYMRNPFLAA